jgi:hypothetical protein
VPLGTLRSLDAVSVALDPALLDATREDRDLAELTRSLVAGAAALGVITVAAGVESQEHLEIARWLGVDAVSGDLVGPLAPLESWSRLLLRGVARLPLAAEPAPEPRRRPFEPRLPDPEPSHLASADETLDPASSSFPASAEGTTLATEALPALSAVEAPPVVESPDEPEIVAPVVDAEPKPDVVAVAETEPVAVPEAPEAAAEPEPPLGDIGASLARELGFDLDDAPAPYAEPAAPPPAYGDSVAPATQPTPPAPDAAGRPTASPFGGAMPGMGSAQPAPGAFAGFALPPSPFLMLREPGAPGGA